jgi:hypothetical protein
MLADDPIPGELVTAQALLDERLNRLRRGWQVGWQRG